MRCCGPCQYNVVLIGDHVPRRGEANFVVVVAFVEILVSKSTIATFVVILFASKPSARVVIRNIIIEDIVCLTLVTLVGRG